jgi:hypothetical protein
MTERNPQEKRANELLTENLDKSYQSKLSNKRKAVEKWSNRGTSGKAELAKELAALQALEKSEDRKSFDGAYIDMDNAVKYGRDAYKSRAFGKPKTKKAGTVDDKTPLPPLKELLERYGTSGIGKVKGYKGGGQVSRGGGKAIAGIKFRGIK